jgi:methylated-DNA-[protein]-cysteine S-methyltransferase
MPHWISFVTALGPMRLAWTASGIFFLHFGEGPGPDASDSQEAPGWVLDAMRRLLSHLAGHPQDLSTIPMDLSGRTPFQRQVMDILKSTRPGQTLSYGDLALLAGRPGAARAVGQAVKANPILILVPCHRVVAAHGPGGWSAFGTPERKARLLELETLHTEPHAAPAPR